MTTSPAPFGKLADGRSVELFTLTNRNGVVVKITNFGGRITELHVPDRHGRFANINLGHTDVKPYTLPDEPFLGALIGRVANRIANGTFKLEGKTFKVPVNNGPNALHGGTSGFDKAIWTAKQSGNVLALSYLSPDGEMGFPGNLQTEVTYTLAEDNSLRIEYSAITDKPTCLNLTNHAYFNLAGPGTGDVLRHEVTIAADRYTPMGDDLLTTGEILPVKGTPFDLTTPTPIGKNIGSLGMGYDTNYVLNQSGESSPAATVYEPTSGRVMQVFTDQPAVQFYTGNFLDGSVSGLGGTYNKHGAFCLETQHFPGATHHAGFPSIELRPGGRYRQFSLFKFSTRS